MVDVWEGKQKIFDVGLSLWTLSDRVHSQAKQSADAQLQGVLYTQSGSQVPGPRRRMFRQLSPSIAELSALTDQAWIAPKNLSAWSRKP